MENAYVTVARTSDILAGQMKLVSLEQKELLIVNVNGNYYVINNRCTHAGGSLSKGKLEGNIIECPRHHARFDVTTGKLISKPKIAFFKPNAADEKVYKVKIENGNIMVKLEE